MAVQDPARYFPGADGVCCLPWNTPLATSVREHVRLFCARPASLFLRSGLRFFCAPGTAAARLPRAAATTRPGAGGLRARALLPGRLLPELLACLVVLLVCPVVLPVFFHFTGLEPGLHRSRFGLLGKPIRPDRDARSACWAFQGGRNGGKETGYRKAPASRQSGKQSGEQASWRAGS